MRWARIDAIATGVVILAWVLLTVAAGPRLGWSASASALLLLLVAWRYATAPRRILKRGLLDGKTIAPLPDWAGKSIDAHVSIACEHFELDRQSLRFWLDRDDFGVGASVIEFRKMSHVVVSVGFLNVLSNSPLTARAVIAHELAHVGQRDTKLWMRTLAFSRVSAGAAILALVLSIPDVVTGTGPIPGEVLLINWGLYRGVRRARWNSEYLADLGAASVVGRDAVYSALQEGGVHIAKKRWHLRFFRSHPTLEQRLKRLGQTTELGQSAAVVT